MAPSTKHEFWIRFVRETLTRLQKLPKWHQTRPEPTPGQVVVVLEEKHRGVWPLGKVIESRPSADGLTRTVKVLVNGSEYVRPIHKIIPLEIFEKDPVEDYSSTDEEDTT